MSSEVIVSVIRSSQIMSVIGAIATGRRPKITPGDITDTVPAQALIAKSTTVYSSCSDSAYVIGFLVHFLQK
jgi:hypothetical protein